MSKFASVHPAQDDPIYSLISLYSNDPNPQKVQVGIGYYQDENGKPWILPSVKMADQIINQDRVKYNHEYPPQPGFPMFLKTCREILFPESDLQTNNRVVSIQAVSGTGSLYVILEFLHRFCPDKKVFLADKTWVIHKVIYEHVYGTVPFSTFHYYENDDLDFGNIYQFLAEEAPAGSIILMQSCAHNPTGIDPSKEQWVDLAKIFQKQGHIAIFDVAAQGFATGSLVEDAFSVKHFAEQNIECFIAQSFSKTCGVYGDRVGCVHVVHNGDAHQSKCIQDQLLKVTRQSWSLNPTYGAQLIAIIGQNEKIRQQLDEDIRLMYERTEKMRQMLYHELNKQKVKGQWLNIRYSKGLFVYLNLSDEQTEHLKSKYSVYMSCNGRVSVSQLQEYEIEYLVSSLKSTLEEVQ